MQVCSQRVRFLHHGCRRSAAGRLPVGLAGRFQGAGARCPQMAGLRQAARQRQADAGRDRRGRRQSAHQHLHRQRCALHRLPHHQRPAWKPTSSNTVRPTSKAVMSAIWRPSICTGTATAATTSTSARNGRPRRRWTATGMCMDCSGRRRAMSSMWTISRAGRAAPPYRPPARTFA